MTVNTLKVFTFPPGESWIVDRFYDEWTSGNRDITTDKIDSCSVIWCMAGWCWNRIPPQILSQKKVIVTVHHEVPDKFNAAEFKARDQFTTVYHVPNEHTAEFVRTKTNRPVIMIPYWANSSIWKKTGTKRDLRKRYGLPLNSYIVGSMQRDTEGHDLKSPKLEKGPDLLADFIIKQHVDRTAIAASIEPQCQCVHVVLAGWRRQYIIDRLEHAHVPYTYFELPSQTVVNDLYQTLDMYPVTSRYEGGPQSLIECGLLGIPVVSRSVGMAELVLPQAAISDDISLAQPIIPDVSALMLPRGFEEYRKLIFTVGGS